MIGLLINLVAIGITRVLEWLASQSTPRLILLFQALLVLIYLLLALFSAFGLPASFSEALSIRVPVSREKLWDHLQDVQKNPLSAQQRVKTTMVISDNCKEWHEEIGSQEIVICKTTDSERPQKLVRECWAEAVSLKGRFIFLLETTTSTTSSNNKDDTSILRIFVTVEAKWGSFLSPLTRLLLHYRPTIIKQVLVEYLQGLCEDMGVPYETAEAWE